jgi:hypothetical protein
MKNKKQTFFIPAIATLALATLLNTASVFAANDDTGSDTSSGNLMAPASESNPEGATKKKQNGQTVAPLNDQTATTAEVQNNRQKALEGSKSPLSVQANFTYGGSSLIHPFASYAPNPSNASVPNIVTFNGVIAARYRLDEATSFGLGTGIYMQHPIEGPAGTISVADPQIDLQHSWKLGKIHNRSDIIMTGWTDQQYSSDLGYLIGFSAVDEAYYTFSFGLTTGIAFEFDYNFFKGQAGYHTAAQTQYDFYPSPYAEFQLSPKLNLRSVINIEALGHQNDMHTAFAQYHQKIQQSLGLGIAALDGLFIYTYVQSQDYYQLNLQNVLFGFNLIINIF